MYAGDGAQPLYKLAVVVQVAGHHQQHVVGVAGNFVACQHLGVVAYQGFECGGLRVAYAGKAQADLGKHVQAQVAAVQVGLVAADIAVVLQPFEAAPARCHAKRQALGQLRGRQCAVLLYMAQYGQVGIVQRCGGVFFFHVCFSSRFLFRMLDNNSKKSKVFASGAP